MAKKTACYPRIIDVPGGDISLVMHIDGQDYACPVSTTWALEAARQLVAAAIRRWPLNIHKDTRG